MNHKMLYKKWKAGLIKEEELSTREKYVLEKYYGVQSIRNEQKPVQRKVRPSKERKTP